MTHRRQVVTRKVYMEHKRIMGDQPKLWYSGRHKATELELGGLVLSVSLGVAGCAMPVVPDCPEMPLYVPPKIASASNTNLKRYKITTNFGSGGRIIPHHEEVDAGTVVNFRVYPDVESGYKIAFVVGCDVKLSCEGTYPDFMEVYTSSAIHSDCTVNVSFSRPSYHNDPSYHHDTFPQHHEKSSGGGGRGGGGGGDRHRRWPWGLQEDEPQPTVDDTQIIPSWYHNKPKPNSNEQLSNELGPSWREPEQPKPPPSEPATSESSTLVPPPPSEPSEPTWPPHKPERPESKPEQSRDESGPPMWHHRRP